MKVTKTIFHNFNDDPVINFKISLTRKDYDRLSEKSQNDLLRVFQRDNGMKVQEEIAQVARSVAQSHEGLRKERQ